VPLFDSLNNPVTGASTYANKILTFVPTNNLTSGASYKVYIPKTAVVDLAGNKMVNDFNSTFTVAPQQIVQDIYLHIISWELQSDHRIKYRFDASKAAISSSCTAVAHPFCAGDQNAWAHDSISDSVNPGFYTITITTFNRSLNFNYGFSCDGKDYWANPTGSWYVNSSKGTFMPAFYDGQFYIDGQQPVFNLPGATGDNYLRRDVVDNKIVIYLNNNYVPGSVAQPFVRGNFTNWAPVDQVISDSSGWGKVETGEPSTYTLELNYGGDYISNSYAVISGSTAYYDSARGILVMPGQ